VRLSPLGMLATSGPVVPAPDVSFVGWGETESTWYVGY
jgi:hypothetical protein